ncbi:DUF5017 domain-containing protein [Bacteroides faecium]|uniref:DUF5017 domain-containing protein n=1 Tax=Bacteroides faecium TaxID=2715212 RepID=A0A6H0KK33_9BACE|nr:DUF5017 domain-containing protein [Bacteroides faecium]QIU93730.1 DUF5017 domain-containing protein [Bacteroides faecium]
MKAYKLIAICAISLFFGACNDGLDEDVALDVTVNTNENVSFDGHIITVKKGTPVNFNIAGDPDFLTFFSGEEGYKYQYRERQTIDPSQIKSSSLTITLYYEYGTTDMVDSRIYISDEFTGLYKDNFVADSLLVEQYENDGIWQSMIPNEELGYAFPTKTGQAASQTYTFDMTQYLNKRVTIAIRYKGVKNTAVQSRLYFTQMHLTNELNNGSSLKFGASSFGLTPVNMKNRCNLPDQATMTTDREYGTVSGGTSGIWNLQGIGTETFYLHSSSAGNPLKYSWLVSDPLTINSCEPDQGTKVKDITQSLDSYTYTYDKVGIYNATFLARNANIDHSSTTTYNFVVNVVE